MPDATPELSAADIAGLFRRAIALHRGGELPQAAALYRQLIDAAPGHADATHLLGVIHQQYGQLDLAVDLIGRSIAIDAGKPAPHSNLGVCLARLGQHEQALAEFDRALALRPDYFEALNNRGNTLRDLGRHEASLASYDRALALRADSVETLINRANALRALHRHAQALATFDEVLRLVPDHVGALVSRGNALQGLKRNEEALASYARALELQPTLHQVHNNRGSALRDLKRYAEAAEAFDRLAKLEPAFPYVESNRLHSRLYCCDWSGHEEAVQRIVQAVEAGEPADVPFSFLAISDSAAAQLQCAQRYTADHHPAAPVAVWSGRAHRHERIRLAYLSADLHDHATAHLMAGLFELHDRDRFEVTAISFGPQANDPMRTRLLSAFDRFVDVRQEGDLQVAERLRELEIDIAIDLKGHTTGNRAGILAHRPAPLQVSYLGYPGTTGADYIDYVLADARVLPAAHLPFYSEKVAWLPDSYQVNDARRLISPDCPSRQQAGLPGQGFVFCCFNNSYKINPPVFAIWMRLLAQVPGSVLWLLEDNADAMRNLRSEANRAGVAPDRLVFAPRLPLEEHLARHRLADLFLDTWPYNAHTTASDALWAGLPVVTCPGGSFAARVALSLLEAVGLPDLACASPAEYEALALALATDPGRLAALRARLERNRLSAPLFDTDRFRRHVEAAYAAMWQRHVLGQPPASFAVPALR